MDEENSVGVGSLTDEQLFNLLFRSVWHGQEGNLSRQLFLMTLTLSDRDHMGLDADSLEKLESFDGKVGRFEENFYEVKRGGVIDWQIMGGLWEDLGNVLSIVGELDNEEYQERSCQSDYKNNLPYLTYKEAIENKRWIRRTDPSLFVDFGKEFRSRLGVALKMSGRVGLEQVSIKVDDIWDKLIRREEYKAQEYSLTIISDKIDWVKSNIQIQTDPDLFEYMLSRLLSNFCREILEESSLHISIWTEGNSLFIADNGTGFPDNYVKEWSRGGLFIDWGSERIDMGGGVGMSMVRVLSEKLGLNIVLSNGKSPQYPGACVEIRLVTDDPLG